jgi:hypothetical protein
MFIWIPFGLKISDANIKKFVVALKIFMISLIVIGIVLPASLYFPSNSMSILVACSLIFFIIACTYPITVAIKGISEAD